MSTKELTDYEVSLKQQLATLKEENEGLVICRNQHLALEAEVKILRQTVKDADYALNHCDILRVESNGSEQWIRLVPDRFLNINLGPGPIRDILRAAREGANSKE